MRKHLGVYFLLMCFIQPVVAAEKKDKDFSFEYFFYSKGYDSGYKEAYAKGKEEGYALGLAKAQEALAMITRPNGIIPIDMNLKVEKKKTAKKKKVSRNTKRRRFIEKEKIDPVTMIFPADDFHKKLFQKTKKPFMRAGEEKIKVMFLSNKRAKVFCIKHEVDPVEEEKAQK